MIKSQPRLTNFTKRLNQNFWRRVSVRGGNLKPDLKLN